MTDFSALPLPARFVCRCPTAGAVRGRARRTARAAGSGAPSCSAPRRHCSCGRRCGWVLPRLRHGGLWAGLCASCAAVMDAVGCFPSLALPDLAHSPHHVCLPVAVNPRRQMCPRRRLSRCSSPTCRRRSGGNDSRAAFNQRSHKALAHAMYRRLFFSFSNPSWVCKPLVVFPCYPLHVVFTIPLPACWATQAISSLLVSPCNSRGTTLQTRTHWSGSVGEWNFRVLRE